MPRKNKTLREAFRQGRGNNRFTFKRQKNKGKITNRRKVVKRKGRFV